MAPDPAETHRLKDIPRDLEPTALALTPPAVRPVGPEAYLVHIYPPGPALGRRTRIERDPVTIGRTGDSGVCDPDPLVSRHHARIELRPDGRFQLTDLGSTNGTFVNDTRTTAAVLADGDYIRIGGSIYRFLTGGNIEALYHEEIHRLAVTDVLTGLPNRRALSDFLDREVSRARRYRRPISLVLFDVDHFKAVNDKLGHVGGDATLRALADVARPLVRNYELLARYGGEEFSVVLPEADAPAAARGGERFREAVERHQFVFEGCRYSLTISVGVGTLVAGEEATVTELIDRADRRLYDAKQNGRNRVRS